MNKPNKAIRISQNNKKTSIFNKIIKISNIKGDTEMFNDENKNEITTLEPELLMGNGGSAAELERASIDMQISTAKKYPRSLEKFKQNAVFMATIDEETAASCLYRRPVGKNQDGKQNFAEGMSIRMAEIVAANFGNLRVGARIISQTPEQVVAQGVAHDLESNFCSSAEVVEPTIDKYGKPYSERMRVVVAKAALAKAWRDATFKVVPRALAKPVEAAVKNLLFGNAASIEKWRTWAKGFIKSLSIDEKRVYKVLNVEGIDDLRSEHFEILVGIQNALKTNDTDIDSAFPAIEEGERFKKPKKKEQSKAEDKNELGIQ